MKAITIFVTIFTIVQATEIDEQWLQFKQLYQKTYTPLEEKYRFSIFDQNLKQINYHNKKYEQGLSKYQMGITKFADLTKDEFLGHLKAKISSNTNNELHQVDHYRSVMDSWDWRNKGAVTDVKNQGQCLASWAFSAVGALEGQYFLKTGKLQSFSPQCLIDCTDPENPNSCIGGSIELAWDYIKEKGVTSENNYPYNGQSNECTCTADNATVKISGYVGIAKDNETALQDAVENIGPIAATIDVSTLQLYTQGIFDDDSCTAKYLNHGVLVVGFGEEDGEKYWIVKNSWGPGWGEDGYARMARDKNNQCGIATYAFYPTLE